MGGKAESAQLEKEKEIICKNSSERKRAPYLRQQQILLLSPSALLLEPANMAEVWPSAPEPPGAHSWDAPAGVSGLTHRELGALLNSPPAKTVQRWEGRPLAPQPVHGELSQLSRVLPPSQVPAHHPTTGTLPYWELGRLNWLYWLYASQLKMSGH